MTKTWTFADILILAALFARDDRQSFAVRRLLKRIELGEMRPRDAARLLNREPETSNG